MIPASIRNNNPGACEPGYATKKFGATTYEVLRWRSADGKPRENRIATFPTPEHGGAAMLHLLATGKHYRDRPIRQAVQTWCGGYWSESYEKAIRARSGITPDTRLTRDLLADPAFAIPLCRAMAHHEAGKPFPMEEDGWRRSHEMAFGDGYAPAATPDNDVPFPKPEAKARETMATVTKAAAAVTTTSAAVTAATTPTETITRTTEAITSATGLGEAVGAAARFAANSPLIVAVSLACGVLVWFWPRIKERM